MNEQFRDGFVRQRRNLMMMSVALFLVETAGVKFSELNLLGSKLFIENPDVINKGLWIAFIYWVYRYYVYFHDIGPKGFMDQYSARMLNYVYAIALKQLKRDSVKMEPLVKEGRTKLRLGHDHTYYRRSLWSYEIKLAVIASLAKRDDDNPKSLDFDHYVVRAPISLAIAHTRAWMYVLTRTHLFSEYLLPFVVALLPVGYLMTSCL